MKAAFFEKQGSPEVIEYGDVPDPEFGLDDVPVDIYAAARMGLRTGVFYERNAQ